MGPTYKNTVLFRFNNIPDACCTKRTGSEENSRIFDQEDEERWGYVLSLQDLHQVQDTSYHSGTSARYRICPTIPGLPPGTGYVLSLRDIRQVQNTSYPSRTSIRYRIRPITPGHFIFKSINKDLGLRSFKLLGSPVRIYF